MRRSGPGAALAAVAAVALGLAAGLAPGAVSAAPPASRAPAIGRSADAPVSAQRRRGVRPGYRRMRARWHARAPVEDRRAWSRADPKPLVLRPVARRDRHVLIPVDEGGGFDAPDRLAAAREAFAYRDDGSTTDVHPRLLELVYRAVLRFEVPYVHLVSGYRPTRDTSRHAQGRAIDMVLPGVSDRGLAAYLRRQGFVGVGLYTASGFVHLDVRAQSYFWVDRSAPGARQRRRRILPELGWKADAAARRRGEEPVPDLVPGAEDEGPDAAGADAEGADPEAPGAPGPDVDDGDGEDAAGPAGRGERAPGTSPRPRVEADEGPPPP